LRSTDLQAFLGIQQLKDLKKIVNSRNKNFLTYQSLISDKFWKIKPPTDSYVSNFAFPLITEKIDELVKVLMDNNIECRPLICGSMNEQPFWYEKYGKEYLPNSHKVHEKGLYLPNHHDITEDEIKFICKIVNSII
jgi:CDP-6-deoxy-D-xylo-4-hexulose-3-dehydrase